MEPSTYTLMPWQKELVARLEGVKPSEMVIFASGRQVGKSYLNHLYNEIMSAPYKQLSEATVDGEKWYTVTGQKSVCAWIRTQDEKMWHEHIDNTWHISFNTFDIHEKIYTMLGMKF